MRTVLLAAVAVVCAAPAGAAETPVYRDRWFYAAVNLQVAERADELVRLIERAGKAGYNGVVLADHKLNLLDRVPGFYFKHLARVRAAADRAGIEIIPAVFPIGYSSGLLAHDANLAEGLPVRDAPFVVREGRARLRLLSEPSPLANGGLEQTRGDRFAGFSFQDEPGKKTFADREVRHGGAVSCRMENFRAGEAANCRLTQRVRLRPHTAYRYSARVRTRELQPSGHFKLLALGRDRTLSFEEGELKPNEDWKEVSIVFNTLDQAEVTLYAGIWDGRSGTAWVDDLKLEPLGLVNVLRRPGCPLTVASADGKTVYEEGKDFAPLRDEKLGQTPWPGEFGFAHRGPDLRLLPGSRIREGDELRVSWYHPVKTHSYQVTCCLSEPRVFELLTRQAELVKKHLAPKTWFFSHDEIRVAGWCKSCQADGPPGRALAANVRRCAAIVRKLDPKARLVVWSDMFDPQHNAVKKYYLVNGTLEGSWEGLPKDMIVANWNGHRTAASLKFFAERGHGQVIAGYYDADPADFHRRTAAARGLAGVDGFMYTTWRHDYRHLEAFGKLMRGGR